MYLRPSGRIDRGAGQLPVGQIDAVLGRAVAEWRQRIVADLVAQPAAAGVDHHADLVLFQAEHLRHVRVEDAIDDLHFEEVVARCRACRTAPSRA